VSLGAGTLDGAMQCPHCHHEGTRVIDSRPADANTAIRRRRVCDSCEHRFTTYERFAPTLVVIKRDGATEPFVGAKLRRGIESALADRPVASGAVDRLVERVEATVRGYGGPIPTEEIGEVVLGGLRALDEVASLRFASVYKDFKDAGDFGRELAELEASVRFPGPPA
jgi:transcriptional repressor NrdR